MGRLGTARRTLPGVDAPDLTSGGGELGTARKTLPGVNPPDLTSGGGGGAGDSTAAYAARSGSSGPDFWEGFLRGLWVLGPGRDLSHEAC